MDEREKMMLDIQRLNSESIENRRQIEELKVNDKKKDDDIRQLYVASGQVQTTLNLILTKIDQNETRIDSKFDNYFRELQSNHEKQMVELVKELQKGASDERKENRSERGALMDKAFDFGKYVVTGIIGAGISYLFQYLTKK